MIIVILGPSGCGKSTLESALEEKGFNRTISYTTRAIRPGEENGKNYHYILKEEFKARFEAGFFAEITKHAGNFYGVAKNDIVQDTVMVVNVDGLKQLRRSLATSIPIVAFFLDIPEGIRIQRMVDRGDSTQVIWERNIYESDHFKDAGNLVDYTLTSTDLQENLAFVLSANEKANEHFREAQLFREMAKAAMATPK